jgi:hypothetical protein
MAVVSSRMRLSWSSLSIGVSREKMNRPEEVKRRAGEGGSRRTARHTAIPPAPKRKETSRKSDWANRIPCCLLFWLYQSPWDKTIMSIMTTGFGIKDGTTDFLD